MEIKNVIGEKYNKLLIIGTAPSKREPSGKLIKRVIIKCDCGTEKELAYREIKKGKTKSCGCLNLENKISVNYGDKYNHWTILNEVEPYVDKQGNKSRRFSSECVCGKVSNITLNTLRQGGSKSCGCMIDRSQVKVKTEPSVIKPLDLEKINSLDLGEWVIIEEISTKRNKTERIDRLCKVKCSCGYIKESLLKNIYKSGKSCAKCTYENRFSDPSELVITKRELLARHSNIKVRCNNPNSKDYKNYGARGIKLCEEWRTLDSFAKWAVANGYSKELTIDRIDNAGDYCPENCKWITRVEQNRNTSFNILDWDKVERIRTLNEPLALLAEEFGCGVDTVRNARNLKSWVR